MVNAEIFKVYTIYTTYNHEMGSFFISILKWLYEYLSPKICLLKQHILNFIV
jgi:hypothetical protein